MPSMARAVPTAPPRSVCRCPRLRTSRTPPWYPIGRLFWSEYHDVSFQGELAAGKPGCTRKHRRALSWFDHDPPGNHDADEELAGRRCEQRPGAAAPDPASPQRRPAARTRLCAASPRRRPCGPTRRQGAPPSIPSTAGPVTCRLLLRSAHLDGVLPRRSQQRQDLVP